MPRKPKQSAAASAPLSAHTHPADSRPTIPTRETAGFSDDAPARAVYPRDPSLDPQLVWKGKDEQDRKPLDVPAVPIFVQEKIQPRAIIEEIRAQAADAARPAQADLFSDFDAPADLAQRLDFYRFPNKWSNRLILGDSLLVMASLAEKERLRGTVQCVYFDPPYGIKFGSNWQVSTRKRDVKDAKAEDLSRQPEQVKAFRDTWELGIHSYLTYMRDRLMAARDLLTETGSIFVQIGDENVHLVRCLMDEVFGSENYCGQIQFKKTGGQSSTVLPSVVDYLLWYSKSKPQVKYRSLYSVKVPGEEGATNYTWIEQLNGDRRTLTSKEIESWSIPPESRVFQPYPMFSDGPSEHDKPFEWQGNFYSPSRGSHWKTTTEGLHQLSLAGRLLAQGKTLRFVNYLSDYPVTPVTNIWADTQISGFAETKIFVVQTLAKVVQRCILMSTDPGDLVLDPTCGSGTTAYVAEQWGRRWITIDTSRVALALARTRLMAAKFPYYLPADSPAGRAKLRELGRPMPDVVKLPGDPDMRQGFVYKVVPHVTLKSIANNPDIREGMSRAEIDAAIAKHADSETLFDQPYEDKATVRVCGPFTVESLSPHRELPEAAERGVGLRPASRGVGLRPASGEQAGGPLHDPEQAGGPLHDPEQAGGPHHEMQAGGPLHDPEQAGGPHHNQPGHYLRAILDNLKAAGVKGTDKAQRITLTRLDSYPGSYVQAEGESDTGTRVRVSVGPELGTVGDQWIGEAALEALKGSGCELLLVCGFAFEASVHERTAELTRETKLGKLRVLPVRINPDLAMFGDDAGRELLKKTGAGNLFTVFGEPDVVIETQPDGKLVATVRGVDVFDPQTGDVRSGGTDDIACWLIDTAYNGREFFVRHAYFTGAGDPYEKLRKALRAEVDESAWAALYRTVSRPFAPPTNGKVAIKVINHFGDEVLKVFATPV